MPEGWSPDDAQGDSKGNKGNAKGAAKGNKGDAKDAEHVQAPGNDWHPECEQPDAQAPGNDWDTEWEQPDAQAPANGEQPDAQAPANDAQEHGGEPDAQALANDAQDKSAEWAGSWDGVPPEMEGWGESDAIVTREDPNTAGGNAACNSGAEEQWEQDHEHDGDEKHHGENAERWETDEAQENAEHWGTDASQENAEHWGTNAWQANAEHGGTNASQEKAEQWGTNAWTTPPTKRPAESPDAQGDYKKRVIPWQVQERRGELKRALHDFDPSSHKRLRWGDDNTWSDWNDVDQSTFATEVDRVEKALEALSSTTGCSPKE
jgi:hypothetical protein